MKIKGHIIAKIVLIVFLSLTFLAIGVMYRSVPEADVQKHRTESLNKPTTTFLDRMDRWSDIKSDDLYYIIKLMTDTNLTIYSVLISTILVLFLDLTVGVGRSRTEERRKIRELEL